MQRVSVCIGINCHSFYVHLARGLNHAAGNFPAIGYENFFYHFSHLHRRFQRVRYPEDFL